jgi:hypothetical protein
MSTTTTTANHMADEDTTKAPSVPHKIITEVYADALDGTLRTKSPNSEMVSYLENLKVNEMLKLIYLTDLKSYQTIESINRLLSIDDLVNTSIGVTTTNGSLDCRLLVKARQRTATTTSTYPDYLHYYDNNDVDGNNNNSYSLNPQVKERLLCKTNVSEQTLIGSEFNLNEILRESSLVCCIYDDIPLHMHNSERTSTVNLAAATFINQYFALNLDRSLKNTNCFSTKSIQMSIRNSIMTRLNELVVSDSQNRSPTIINSIVDSLNTTDCLFNSFFSFDNNGDSNMYVADRKFFIFSYCFINRCDNDDNGKLVVFLLNCMPSVIKDSLINNSSDIYVFNKFLFRLNAGSTTMPDDEDNDGANEANDTDNDDDDDDNDLITVDNDNITASNGPRERPTNKYSHLSKLIKSLTVNLNCIYSSYIDYIEKLCSTSYLNSILMYLGRTLAIFFFLNLIFTQWYII